MLHVGGLARGIPSGKVINLGKFSGVREVVNILIQWPACSV